MNISHTIKVWFTALIAITLLIAIGSAKASVADLFGITPYALAYARANVATSQSFDSCYANPAALALMEPGLKVGFGYLYFESHLKANDKRLKFNENWGITAGVAGIVPMRSFLENRIGVGLLMYLPSANLLWIHLHTRDDPHFPLYENRFQRLVVRPAIALRVWKRLSVGVGLNYYVDLNGAVVSNTGPGRDLVATANLEMLSHLSFDFAATFEPTKWLRTAIVWRSEQRTDIHFITKNRMGGISLDLDIAGIALYEPAVLELAAGFTLKNIGLIVSTGFAWRFWSQYSGDATYLDASVPSGTEENKHFPPVKTTPNASDTYEIKIAAEKIFRASNWLNISLAAGYAYEPAALPIQRGESNLLDSDKHKIGTGMFANFNFGKAVFSHLKVGVAGQVQILPERAHKKDATLLVDENPDTPELDTSNPGWEKITGGGYVWATTIMISLKR